MVEHVGVDGDREAASEIEQVPATGRVDAVGAEVRGESESLVVVVDVDDAWSTGYPSALWGGPEQRAGHSAPEPVMPLSLVASRPLSCAQRVAVARVEVPILV